MSNPIPPFVCNTPPPIECISDVPPPLPEDDFGDFAVVEDHNQFEVSSLPVTPVHVAKMPDTSPNTRNNTSPLPPPLTSDSIYDFPSENINHTSGAKENSTLSFYPPPVSAISTSSKNDVKIDLPYILEANSPPPFEYVVEDDDDLPPCVAELEDDDDDVDEDDEPDEFVVDDDMAKYDDNISLPSLKFDSLSNHSKSTTPVSEELSKPKLEDSEIISKIEDIEVEDLPPMNVELVLKTTESVEEQDEELNSVPIESINVIGQLDEKDLTNDLNLQQSSKEQEEDDFAEFEAFSVPLETSNDEPHEENTAQLSEKAIEDNVTASTEPVFEADFSQFSNFVTETIPPPVTSQLIENTQLTEKSNLNDLDADDFDDFQDYTLPAPATTFERTKEEESFAAPLEIPEKESPTENEAITKKSDDNDDDDDDNVDDDDDDDDFGEFSEVVETTEISHIPSSNSGFNLTNLNDKLKPILEMMFPVANKENDQEKENSESTPPSLKDLNKLTDINQIDTAKALEHQWINSEVRHSLIKSLGVDSRNILYGEKWNSSMPRFAANLSFNPLEPMKTDKSTTNNNSSNNNNSTIDYRKRSESLTSSTSSMTASKSDVPAVEFDWNSSGLVNPLDGVKEILHEGTVETIHPTKSGESNASIDEQSSTTFKSNTNIINNTNNNVNNIYDSNKSLRCFIDDEETISTTSEFKSNADASIAIPTATTAATNNIVTSSGTATALSANNNNDLTRCKFQSSGVLETDLDVISTTATTISPSTVITTSQVLNHNKNHSAKYQESLKTDLETESQHSGVVSTSTYSGPLKETHIFTPSKGDNGLSSRLSSSSSLSISGPTTKTPPRTSESKCPIDFDYEIAAAGIIIDETVVKKEYRDVEYNPGFGSKYRNEDTIEHNHRLSPEINSSKHIPYKNDLVNSSLDKAINPLDDDDVTQVLPKEKNIVENTKAILSKSSSFDDEFSDFQSVPPPLTFAKPLSTIVPSFIPSPATVVEPKTSPSHLRRVLKETTDVSSTSLGSRTGTPVSVSDEMILCPAILIPQAIQMENKPKIEWPEPGINPQELARIEELFPQPKTTNSSKPSPSHSGGGKSHQSTASNRATPNLSTAKGAAAVDDDDWSDFVSVPAVIAPQTNHIQSISQQFQKSKLSPAKSVAVDSNNDDEWSDFVSSAPPPAAPIANNMRPNAYPQFNSASWQNANFYNNPMSAYASPPTSFYYQPPSTLQQPQLQQQQKQQQQHQHQQNLSNNLVPNMTNLNNNNQSANNNMVFNNNNNNSINQYLMMNNQANHLNHHHQQHIHMMRDFSSASPMDGGPLSSSTAHHHNQYPAQGIPGYGYNNRGIHHQQQQIQQQHQHQHQYGKSPSQFGSGSSKIAPSISLIPDLGFVAPAHTSFISVPKNSFVTKK